MCAKFTELRHSSILCARAHEHISAIILVDFKFGGLRAYRQTTKFNSPPNFMAIRYYILKCLQHGKETVCCPVQAQLDTIQGIISCKHIYEKRSTLGSSRQMCFLKTHLYKPTLQQQYDFVLMMNATLGTIE